MGALMTWRRTVIALFLPAAAAAVAACGSQDIKLDANADADERRGAQIFSERCAGCHSLSYTGSEGSPTALGDRERIDGPNFDVRKEQYDQVLYAIRNGGFSGALMPQNIVVGAEAEDVARFLAAYSGRDARAPKSPTPRNQPAGGEREERSGQPDDPAGRSPSGGG